MHKILFLGANPTGTTRLSLDREVRTIDERLRLSTLRDYFVFEQAWAVRVEDLTGLLLRHRPAIVHFSGHGSTVGELALEDSAGTPRSVPSAALARLFKSLTRRPRLVILNACYSEHQARVIVEHVDVVVGMSVAIKDASAREFAAGFYEALGYGESVRAAFDLACAKIDLQGLGQGDVPQLLVRAGVDPATLVLADPP